MTLCSDDKTADCVRKLKTYRKMRNMNRKGKRQNKKKGQKESANGKNTIKTDRKSVESLNNSD